MKLEALATAYRTSKNLGIDDIKKYVDQTTGWQVWVPDILGTSSAFLKPYKKNGFNHKNDKERQTAWEAALNDPRQVMVIFSESPQDDFNIYLPSGEVLKNILNEMKKDPIVAAWYKYKMGRHGAYAFLYGGEDIQHDTEVEEKLFKYHLANI